MTYSGDIKSVVQRGSSSLYDVTFKDGTATVVQASALPLALTPFEMFDASGALAASVDALTGNLVLANGLVVTGVQTDGYLWVPPSEIETVPVANIAYANDVIAGSTKNIACLKATDSTAGATSEFQVDLSKALRTAANKGMAVTEVDVFATWTVGTLSGNVGFAIYGQTMPVVGAAAAAPTEVLTLGGALTVTNFAALTTPTAGRFSGAGAVPATPVFLNTPLQRVIASITFPQSTNTVVFVAGVLVKFNKATF